MVAPAGSTGEPCATKGISTDIARSTEEPHAISTDMETRCRLFELPAELRTYIWELALTPNMPSTDDNGMSTADLFDAHACGPRPCLLLACRQIHNEAIAIFKDAIEEFWRSTYFYINSTSIDKQTIDAIYSLDDEKLKHITKLTIEGRKLGIVFPGSSTPFRQRRFYFKRNTWTCLSECCIRMSTFRCPVRTILSDVKADTLKKSMQRNIECLDRMERFYAEDPWYNLITLGAKLSDEEIQSAKKAAGWPYLARKELLLMLGWYHCHGEIS